MNRHWNKLKVGHLAGNRFVIRVREVAKAALPQAEAILDVLIQQGVPNFFGEQRFGNRGNTDRLGELLIRKDIVEFVAEYLGRPRSQEALYVQAARQLVDEGRWGEALQQWPGNLADEKKAIAALCRSNGQLEVVLKVLNPRLKNLFISAFQAKLFNALLIQRLDRLGQLEAGDVAYIHNKGAAFIVEQTEVERAQGRQL